MMRRVLALLGVAGLMACGLPAGATPLPQFADDDLSGFSSNEANQRAQAAIDRAGAVFDKVKASAASYVKGAAGGRADCAAPSLERAIDSLRPVDDDARAYLDQAWSPQGDPSDREAAMDVLDELNGAILDGLVEIIRAYRVTGCTTRAQQLITDVKRIYAGPAYAGWLKDIDAEQSALDRAIAAARQRRPVASATREGAAGTAAKSPTSRMP
jgi:hypothetical protein